MRLLHTQTLVLHEFFGQDAPPYAILSHRWEAAEVTYQDLMKSYGHQMQGWAKITGCCARAALDGWEYAWIDSCCIDKSSSAELSEAINSMYAWYRNARVCYVYLSDVRQGQDPFAASSDFRKSKWFARGWTLQELLAPQFLEFYDQNWHEIGSKSSFNALVSEITRIPNNFLVDSEGASVAQKMSWASKRVTTRIEDEAYCLMGLFGVHMPPLYGEGRNAFIRLQLEIMSRDDDESIFAWEYPQAQLEVDKFHGYEYDSDEARDYYFSTIGLLAWSAACFENSGDIVYAYFHGGREPPKMTSRGLNLNLPMKFAPDTPDESRYFANSLIYMAPLNCKRHAQKIIDPKSNSNTSEGLSSVTRAKQRYIALKIIKDWGIAETYKREAGLYELEADRYQDNALGFETSTMYFRQREISTPEDANYGPISMKLIFDNVTGYGFQLTDYAQSDIRKFPTLDHADLDTVTLSNDNKSSEPWPRLVDHGILGFRDENLIAGATFRKPGLKPWVLIMLSNTGTPVIDVATLFPTETTKSILDDSAIFFDDYLLIPAADRVSLEVGDGIFVSAALKRMRQETNGVAYQVHLTIDDHPKWPAPAQAWKVRDQKRKERADKPARHFLVLE